MIYLGADHAGYEMKIALKAFLDELKMQYVDLGVFSHDAADYPDIAREVGEKVVENGDADGSTGILICGTGTGMAMAANKLDGVRAAVATSEEMARLAREHNDANILAVGSRITDLDTVKRMVKAFLEAKFSGEERHKRRVEKISSLEHHHTHE